VKATLLRLIFSGRRVFRFERFALVLGIRYGFFFFW
jgi:hypothetical protein